MDYKKRSKLENSPVQVSIPVESGEMLFFNHFNEVFTYHDHFDQNTSLGKQKRIIDCAKNGILSNSVGDSGVCIYKKGNKIYIGSLESNHPLAKYKVGSIGSDDGWSFSFIDKNRYNQLKALKNELIPENKEIKSLKVKNGTYLMTTFLHNPEDTSNVLYAKIELSNKKPKNVKFPEEKIIKDIQKIVGRDIIVMVRPLYFSGDSQNGFSGYDCFLIKSKDNKTKTAEFILNQKQVDSRLKKIITENLTELNKKKYHKYF